MGWIRKQIEKKKYMASIKKYVLDIEMMEQIAKYIYLTSERKEFIRKWVKEYNERNDIEIPEELVLRLYDIKYKGKNGDIKKEFLEIVYKISEQIVIKYLPVLIDIAVKILFK